MADEAGGRPRDPGYGPLVDDPNHLLSLPAGFTYAIVAQSGVRKLESGEPTPSDPTARRAFTAAVGAAS